MFNIIYCLTPYMVLLPRPTAGRVLDKLYVTHPCPWWFFLKSLSTSQGYIVFALPITGLLPKHYCWHIPVPSCNTEANRAQFFWPRFTFLHLLALLGKLQVPGLPSALPSFFYSPAYNSLVPQLCWNPVIRKWYKVEPNFWQLPKRHKPVNPQKKKIFFFGHTALHAGS